MISYLHGRLNQRDEQGATIEVAGVGYRLLMSTQSLATAGELGAEATIYTLLQIRDDTLVLYGFTTTEEKALFEKLITVSGIGPKVALSALSSFAPGELALLISEGDVKRISTVPGIGTKTAQRLVLELKGILELDMKRSDETDEVESKEATNALLSMGFTNSEIIAALKGYEGPGDDTSALLRYALKRLGG